MGDRHIRSVTKAVSWRITASLITVLLVFLITGKINLALSVGILDVIIKIIAFYVHERIWNKIRWGKDKKL